jgi:hypothetical protein
MLFGPACQLAVINLMSSVIAVRGHLVASDNMLHLDVFLSMTPTNNRSHLEFFPSVTQSDNRSHLEPFSSATPSEFENRLHLEAFSSVTSSDHGPHFKVFPSMVHVSLHSSSPLSHLLIVQTYWTYLFIYCFTYLFIFC